jgi:hypothetical protein
MKDDTNSEILTKLMMNKAGILKTGKITIEGVTGEYKHVTKAEVLEQLKAIENPPKEVQEMIEQLQILIVREQLDESE